jgi:hypothetical protein
VQLSEVLGTQAHPAASAEVKSAITPRYRCALDAKPSKVVPGHIHEYWGTGLYPANLLPSGEVTDNNLETFGEAEVACASPGAITRQASATSSTSEPFGLSRTFDSTWRL